MVFIIDLIFIVYVLFKVEMIFYVGKEVDNGF